MGKVVDTRAVAEAIGYCSTSDLVELSVQLRTEMGLEGIQILINLLSQELERSTVCYAARVWMNTDKKIQMIKTVRIIERMGLKQAKEYVDAWFSNFYKDPSSWQYVDLGKTGNRDTLTLKVKEASENTAIAVEIVEV